MYLDITIHNSSLNIHLIVNVNNQYCPSGILPILSNKNIRHSIKFEFQVTSIVFSTSMSQILYKMYYSKKVNHFLNLKFKCNWLSYILSGNPNEYKNLRIAEFA